MKSFSPGFVFIAVLIAGMVAGTVTSSPADYRVDVSAAQKALMQQVEQTYLSRRGLTFAEVLNRDPVSASRLLGIGMMTQVEYSKRSRQDRDKYFALAGDIRKFLRQLADIHRKDGARTVTYEVLWNNFRQGFTGKSNDWAMKSFGLNPFDVRQPSVLHLATGGVQTVPEKRARIPMGEPENGAVNLLGQRADRVEAPPRSAPPPPPPPGPQESKYRWQVMGIYTNPTWESGAFKKYSSFGNPEKPVISSILECCNSTKGCPGRTRVKVVPCKPVAGNCVMKVQLLKDSQLGRKGEIKCILLTK